MRSTSLACALSLLSLVLLTGCKSKHVVAAVRNQTGATVTLVELDYPSASFGKESLASGTEYDYSFKILGSGATKVLWTDAAHQAHTVDGPELDEGQAGSLVVTLEPGGKAVWEKNLAP
jgi:hypothetical protein